MRASEMLDLHSTRAAVRQVSSFPPLATRLARSPAIQLVARPLEHA